MDRPISVLLVDDEPSALRAMARHFLAAQFEVDTRGGGEAAMDRIRAGGVEVVVTDLAMPGMSGSELLRAARRYDADLPVILVTGVPTVHAAADAVEYGAFMFIMKPYIARNLVQTVERAARMYRLARAKREALSLFGTSIGEDAGRVALEASFRRALASLWLAFQPIVRGPNAEVFGYEALLRTREPSLPHPGAVLDAAERLGTLAEVGRAIRDRAAADFERAHAGWKLFVNLHPEDLLDDRIFAKDSALSSMAERVVLEITERASLEKVRDVGGRVAALRKLGFQIAVDDLGAGYAGLASFAQLEPDIVKLDMSLVRDVHASATKQKLVHSMASLCRSMGMQVVAEGVETEPERDMLSELGCDLMQGYRFAKPAPPFPEPRW